MELTGKWGPHGTEILRFWKAKMKYVNIKSSKSRWEKWGHLSSYDYSQRYGHQNVKDGSFYVLSAEDSKNSVPVWARYLNTSERSSFALLQNTMDYGVLRYH